MIASLPTDDGQNARLGAKNMNAAYHLRLSVGTASAAARYQRYAPKNAMMPNTRNDVIRSLPMTHVHVRQEVLDEVRLAEVRERLRDSLQVLVGVPRVDLRVGSLVGTDERVVAGDRRHELDDHAPHDHAPDPRFLGVTVLHEPSQCRGGRQAEPAEEDAGQRTGCVRLPAHDRGTQRGAGREDERQRARVADGGAETGHRLGTGRRGRALAGRSRRRRPRSPRTESVRAARPDRVGHLHRAARRGGTATMPPRLDREALRRSGAARVRAAPGSRPGPPCTLGRGERPYYGRHGCDGARPHAALTSPDACCGASRASVTAAPSSCSSRARTPRRRAAASYRVVYLLPWKDALVATLEAEGVATTLPRRPELLGSALDGPAAPGTARATRSTWCTSIRHSSPPGPGWSCGRCRAPSVPRW